MSDAAIEIKYVAEPTATMFHACDDRVRGVLGPIGSGKSVMCVMEIIMRALAQEPHNGVRRTRWGVIRNTYGELRTTTIKTWQDWMPANVATIRWDQPITAKMAQDLPDGTRVEMEVLFVSVDRPADVKKLLSLELTGAWINEAREISKSTLDQLTGRIGRYPSKRDGGASWHGIIMDTNPPDTDHWWYRIFEQEKPRGYSLFHQPPALIRVDNGYRANPEAENASNHNRGHYYWLDLVAGKTEEWIKVYVLGQYGTTSDGKPVYPEWMDSLHVAPDVILPWRGLPLIMGWDCSGLRPAVVFGQVTNRGQLRIIDELLAIDMGIKQFAADIVKPHLANKYPSMTLISVGDPAGKAKTPTNESTIYDELRKAGLDTIPASTNLFVPRREAVAGFLTRIIDGEPGFLLSPNCENLRQGFNGKYYYKRVQVTGEDRWKDEPADNDWTHLQDGAQYLCLHVSGDREMKGRSQRREVRQTQKGRPAFFR